MAFETIFFYPSIDRLPIWRSAHGCWFDLDHRCSYYI